MYDSYYLGKHQKEMVKFRLKTLLVRLKKKKLNYWSFISKVMKTEVSEVNVWCMTPPPIPHPPPKHPPLPFPTSPTQPPPLSYLKVFYRTSSVEVVWHWLLYITVRCIWMGCKEPWQNIDIWWAWPENGLNPWHVACTSIYRWKLNIRIGAVLPWRFSQLSTLNCHLGYLWCTNAKLCKHAIFF